MPIIAPYYGAKETAGDSVIFLAGPIKGAPKWQDNAIEYILGKDSRFLIATPTKRLRDVYLESIDENSDRSNLFNSGTIWERRYIQEGFDTGAVVLWMPAQIEAMPINPDTGFPKPYARDTRGEQGQFVEKLRNDRNLRLAIGYEECFDGVDVIIKNFRDVNPDVVFHTSLEETLDAAIEIAKRK